MEYFSLGEFICPHCEQPHPSDVEFCPATGKNLDHVHKMGGTLLQRTYRVREFLAEGGMGVIYRCEHRSIGHSLAVKFLNPEGCESREAYDRFLQEARLAASIDHPGIVKTFDLGITQAGVPYIVMELLEGEDLGVRLARRGTLGVEESVDLIRQLLGALAAVHAVGIVHRDLKPENLFIATQSGGEQILKILDFGISRLLRRTPGSVDDRESGRIFGTPTYMSPEQTRADDGVDHRSDLWAAGAMLFELLTGRPPFVANSQSQLVVDVLTRPVQDPRILRPEIPEHVARTVLVSLRKDPSERFGSAASMLESLGRSTYAEHRLR
jgi:serine/threonine-protein kinase